VNLMRMGVILLLFVNLGLSLGAEILSKDVHSPFEHSHVASEQTKSSQTLEDKNCQNPAHSQDKECFDPCHAGGCHLGHCSFAFRTFATNVFPPAIDQVINANRVSTIEEPHLEGFRRPPKIA
jgi:hypothetical protein